jgi:hypothetical protein
MGADAILNRSALTVLFLLFIWERRLLVECYTTGSLRRHRRSERNTYRKCLFGNIDHEFPSGLPRFEKGVCIGD